MAHVFGVVGGSAVIPRSAVAAALLAAAVAQPLFAGTLEDIGITQLRSLDPTLTGAGVSVAQVEATTYSGPSVYDPAFDADNFEFNPSSIITGTIVPGFTFRGKVGTSPTTTFNAGQYSDHANQVASRFFGTSGAASGMNAVVNYNDNYFYSNVLDNNSAMDLPLAPANASAISVVNQSFVYLNASASDSNFINQLYDNYVRVHNTIFVSAVGNGGAPQAPSTAFNVIAVGAYPGSSSTGPTSGVSSASDGRSKPDIDVPEGATSFSTPYVSGIAAILVQAGAAGRGGSGTQAAATDARTIKALLLNGATKPAGWTHSAAQPLDPNWGAGVANAYNSYLNLTAGQKNANTVNTSQAPVIGAGLGNEGWTLASINSSNVAHYSLDITAADGPSTLTSTLVWWRPQGTVQTDANGFITYIDVTAINNLDLLLYNAAGSLVDESDSTVDNVEQLYTNGLAPGHYDLQVIKAAGGSTPSESYALAFNLTGGAITLNVVGTVDLHGISQSVGGITGNGTVINSVADTTATLTVVGSSQFDGALLNSAGAIALAKTTGGILTLTGASTYTGGTQVSGGTLLVSNTSGSATGAGSVTLDGGTLGGHGIISGTVLAGAGPHTIAPSATLSGNTANTLTLGGLTTGNQTTLAFNLASPGPSSVNDKLVITGTNALSLSGGHLSITNTNTGVSSLGYYKAIAYNGTLGGTLSSITMPTVVNNISYVLDSAHDPGFIDIHRGFLGDANDDGTVNFDDFLILSQNFGQAGGWSKANFIGDATVDFNDFLVLSQHFGQSITSGNSVASPEDLAQFQAASAAFFSSAPSSVPEPGSLAMLAAGMLLLVRKRSVRPGRT